MKRFFILAVVFSTLAFTISRPTVSNFIFTTVNDVPDLPDDPYDYSNITFPDHLLSAEDDTIDLGYEGGGIDSLSFAEITDNGATLGRVLFYDKKLSSLETMSCATCHNQAMSFAENKPVSDGLTAPTLRNSMHLNDIAWTNKDHFFWDMSESDLRTMIRLPLTDENEIGADMDDIAEKLGETSYYPQLFTDAFGDSEITEDRIAEALVQFISSMTTFNSRFDQEAANGFAGFTAQEQLGLDLFSANCNGCHSQGGHNVFGDIFPTGFPVLEIFPFIFNNGLPEDPEDAGAGTWQPGFENLFKIPTLRNIDLTAPYMHDGRFETLEEVVNHYSDEVEENEWTMEFFPPGGFGFTDTEKEALVAFMETLTDESFLTAPRWSDPFGLETSLENFTIENLVIRPNPTRDVAVIEYDNPANEIVTFHIFTADGKLVLNEQTRSDNYTLDKGLFQAGTYFIEVLMDDRKSTAKLMVQ